MGVNKKYFRLFFLQWDPGEQIRSMEYAALHLVPFLGSLNETENLERDYESVKLVKKGSFLFGLATQNQIRRL